MTIKLLLLFLLSFVVAILLIPIVKIIAHKLKILDYPDKRKIHKEPIPYLGGMAITFAFLIGLFIAIFIYHIIPKPDGLVIVVATFLIFLLGLFDDIKGSNAKIKFAVQFIIAIFIVNNDIYLKTLTNPITGSVILLGNWGYIFSVIWIVSISNAINLLDGLDGLAAGISAISILFMIAFSISSNHIILVAFLLPLLGGILGFLIFNFPPAKIFMGDAGSLTIGFLFSVFCLMPSAKGPYTITIIVPAMLLTIPILDTFLAILRRVKNKQKIFSADKMHLHHRLLNLNKSFTKTLLIIYVANIIIGIIASLTFFLPNNYRIIFMFILAQDILFGIYILHLFEKKKNFKDQLKKFDETN